MSEIQTAVRFGYRPFAGGCWDDLTPQQRSLLMAAGDVLDDAATRGMNEPRR
ncbi:MAG: hypothetical protein AAGF47_03785 [Planctomycetota bacterium]